MRILTPLALLAIAAVAGCASTPAAAPAPTQVASAAPATAPRQVCAKERPIGSTMAQTVCHDVDENGNTQATVDDLNRQMNGGNSGMLGRGGAGH